MCLLSFVSFYHLITCAFKSTNWISPHPESYRRDWICDLRLLSFLGLLDAVVESPFLFMGLSTCPALRMGADHNLLTSCLRLISGFIDICKQSDCLACHTLWTFRHGSSSSYASASFRHILILPWEKCFKRQACVCFISVTHLLLCGLSQLYCNDISLNSMANDLVAFVNLHCVIMYDLRVIC